MVTTREFFEVIKPHEVTVDCSKMWAAFDNAHKELGDADNYDTCSWYGNSGLPVLPCYEVLSYENGYQRNVLFVTREQNEILADWWETTEDFVLVSEKYNQYNIFTGDIDEIFIFDGDYSELINLR